MHRVQIAFPSSLTSLSPIQGFLGSPPKYTTCPPFLVSGSAAGKSSFRRVVTKKDWILGKDNRYSYGKPKKKMLGIAGKTNVSQLLNQAPLWIP